MPKQPIHTFHIPVMGLAYTVDSPIRVAQYGISSVISIVDDELLEKMNHFYASLYQLPFVETGLKDLDYRAKRITSYLNLVDKIVKRKLESFKAELSESIQALQRFSDMLPTGSALREKLEDFVSGHFTNPKMLREFLDDHLTPGAIDVNIMTKVDKDNFHKNEKLAVEFNDAHAALRGFANSGLRSSVVLSAGMNPRLFSYFEKFPCFFPNAEGTFEKQIILKVSDFRSAMIQGNFLAKKGLWVSEYRIESGLNCGGHAFATEGLLLGPILEEFMQKKDQLGESAFDLMSKALTSKGLCTPKTAPCIRITVQGGVGTATEHDFLLKHYKVDSVGWGSPFLLVPEATSTDKATRDLLANGKESDFYLSNMSPLGVPFNTIKGTTNEAFHHKRIKENKPGSSCPKKLLALHTGTDGKGVCTASRKYQQDQLSSLALEKNSLDEASLEKRACRITEKACLCVGLANASYLENQIPIKGQAQGVVVCPGPNMAYFDKEVSLFDMVRHIYGETSVLGATPRPHMFLKELHLYVNHLKNEMGDMAEMPPAQCKKWETFRENLLRGIDYYKDLYASNGFGQPCSDSIPKVLEKYEQEVNRLVIGAFQPV
ncbi:hypothetical protein [Flavobacterium sp.]|uniref:hypothetical protein n=1 Tax=Flavobacterium sp. TaxID=239 RepID=UPI00260F1163|nr:hypothetical protein [Flavobacterium sp.]